MVVVRSLTATHRFAHFGTADGDSAARTRQRWPVVLDRCRSVGVRRVVLPALQFVHDIATSEDLTWHTEQLATSSRPGDGVLISEPDLAVAIANGDCSVGLLSHPDGRFVAMHLGLDCLWRSDGGPILIELAADKLGDVSQLRFWVGAGIGPCCHGYDHTRPEHRQRAVVLRSLHGADVIGSTVEHGPRKGQVAYDHVLMAARAAAKLGLADVTMDRRCTACAGLADPDHPGYGTWYSNTRDQHGARERNLALVWRTNDTS